ncbi:MAG: MBL fold metallo-hydrolase [Candidatus Thorarchaeota archaeon]
MNKDFFFIKANKPMWPASANIFVIKDEDGVVLIEVGCGLKKFTKKLFKKLDELNLKLNDIHTIVISHAHPDHMGGMDAIYEKINPSDVEIIINEIEKDSALNIELLNSSFDMDLLEKYFESELEFLVSSSRTQRDNSGRRLDINRNFKTYCAMSQLPEEAYIHTIKENDILKLGNYKFKVLTTPGHALGHTSFYELNHKFLLSGDLIGEFGTAWYSPSSGGAIGYLSSLEKVEKHPIKYIYPSHGNKLYNVKERINQIRSKIMIKDDIILENLEKKPHTILELIKLFYKTKLSQIFPGVAIIESHLIKLEMENKIKRKNNLIFKI